MDSLLDKFIYAMILKKITIMIKFRWINMIKNVLIFQQDNSVQQKVYYFQKTIDLMVLVHHQVENHIGPHKRKMDHEKNTNHQKQYLNTMKWIFL